MTSRPFVECLSATLTVFSRHPSAHEVWGEAPEGADVWVATFADAEEARKFIESKGVHCARARGQTPELSKL